VETQGVETLGPYNGFIFELQR